MRKWQTALPIDSSLDAITETALRKRALVVEAPPGAGKTTRVPQALLDRIDGEILVLEPRRLAARMAAERVASELGEAIGQSVGYKVRFLERVSKQTRLTFVTEGILTRRMLSDRTLKGVSCVILDEVHERHLQGDLALALLSDLKKETRPDLILIAMSATLDAKPLADFLGAEIVRTEGKRFDVAIEYEEDDGRALELRVASAVRKIAKEEADGHVLVFLPGAREIRLAMEASDGAARAHGLTLLPLHGDLSAEDQDRAVKQGGSRKVIFSTNVAESSITIDGVVGVVDSGLHRIATHSAWSGFSELAVAKISRASAIQRAGRAGRTREGRAIRLYPKSDFETRPAHDPAEIARADLTTTALELRSYGRTNLQWFEAPPARAWDAAESLLVNLGATNDKGALTEVGEKMLAYAFHPRIARVLVEAESRGVLRSAITLAAILSEKDIRVATRAQFGRQGTNDRATESSDAVAMLDAFDDAKESSFSRHSLTSLGLEYRAVMAVDRARTSLLRSRQLEEDSAKDRDEALGICVLAGFPDRVARRKRQGSRDLIMPGFGAAELSETSVVRDAIFVCAIDAEERRDRGASGKPVVRVASAFDPLHVLDLFPERVEERTVVLFDEARERVTGKKELVFFGLVIDETILDAKSDPRAKDALFKAAMSRGPRAFAPEGELDRWIMRARFASVQDTTIIPPTDETLAEVMSELCEGRSSFEELKHAGFLDLVIARTEGRSRIEKIAPDRIELASTRNTRVFYEDGKPPWVESFLQDFCGTIETPKAGRVPMTVHLLAPNRRAVQVTSDLAGFWDRHYPAVRKELMRKYPRHGWPEDPRAAPVIAKSFGRRR